MNTPNDGGPAFPSVDSWRDRNDKHVNERDIGMSIRDWFARQEQLQDLDSFGDEMAIALAGPKPEGNWQTNSVAWLEWDAKVRARLKYIRADAMLKARGDNK